MGFGLERSGPTDRNLYAYSFLILQEDSEVPDHHELIRRISNKFQMSIVCGTVDNSINQPS
jgi:hypothetical protein